MGSAAKLKISVTLSSDLLTGIDRQVAVAGGNRSAVIERLLRRASREEALADLERSTAAYYDALSASQRLEDDALSRASGAAGRKLAIDEPAARPRRPRRRSG